MVAAEPPLPASDLRTPFRLRRALLTVLIAGGLLRLLAIGSLPLVLTNDSTDYVPYGVRIQHGDWAPPRADRTPGYPALLAVSFFAFGLSGAGVALTQQSVVLGGCLLLTWAIARRTGPITGMIAGLLAALDPWLLGYGQFALTEAPATAAALVLAAATILPTRRAWLRMAVLGLALAAACLIRPTFQILVPFCVIGWALSVPAAWSRRAALSAGAAGVMLAGLTPWLILQASTRGAPRLSFGAGAHLFSGVGRVGLQKEDFPLPDVVREAYEPFAGRPLDDHAFWIFCKRVDGLAAREPLLRDWAVASIAARPRDYLRCAACALCWQLNFSPGRDPCFSEVSWALDRVTQVGSGVQYERSGPHPLLDKFDHWSEGGWLRPILRRIATRAPPGVPQVPLLALALITCVLALRRGEFAISLLLLGTFAFVAAHAAYLFPNGRYSLPAWTVWYIAPPLLACWLIAARRRVARQPAP